MRWFILLTVVLFGALTAHPLADWLIFQTVGTHLVSGIDTDGTRRDLILGPQAPRPDWLPEPRGAVTLTAAQDLRGQGHGPGGGHDLLVDDTVDGVLSFYADALARVGFAMGEPRSRREDAYFGIAAQLIGRRDSDAVEISVLVREPQSPLSRQRVVQVFWTTRP